MVTSAQTNCISPGAFSARLNLLLTQRVIDVSPMTSCGPLAQDCNFYLGPSKTDPRKYERPLGSLVRMRFSPNIPFDEKHAKLLGAKRSHLQQTVDLVLDMKGRRPKPAIVNHRHNPLGVDLSVGDLTLKMAMVLAASDNAEYKKLAAKKLREAARWYSHGQLNLNAAIVAEMSALFYMDIDEMHETESMRLFVSASHFLAAQYWLKAIQFRTDALEHEIGAYRGIRNWLIAKRLYDGLLQTPYGDLLLIHPGNVEHCFSDEELRDADFVEGMNLNPAMLCDLLDISAKLHDRRGLRVTATNDRLFKLFQVKHRNGKQHWVEAEETLQKAASQWEKTKKTTDVIDEAKELASLAKAIRKNNHG